MGALLTLSQVVQQALINFHIAYFEQNMEIRNLLQGLYFYEKSI